jgi:hypothetical protein
VHRRTIECSCGNVVSLEPGNHYQLYPSIRKVVHSRCGCCLKPLTYWVQGEYVEDIKKKKDKRLNRSSREEQDSSVEEV